MLKKLADEILEVLILDLSRPFLANLAAKDLFIDNLFSIAMEWRPTTGHLVENHAEGPQVTKCS